jgi:hypothetical protein
MYKKIVLVLSLAIAILFSLCFLGSNYLLFTLKNHIKSNNNHITAKSSSINIKAEDLSINVTLKKISLNLHKPSIIYNNEEVTFTDQISLTIDSFSLKPYIQITSNGECNAESRKNKFLLDAAIKPIIKYDFAILKSIFKHPASLISAINGVGIDIKLFQLFDEKNLISETKNTNYRIDAKFGDQIMKFEDIASNLPQKYSITAEIDTINRFGDYNRSLILKPFSITNFSIKGKIFIDYENPKLSNKSNNYLANSKIKFACNKCDTHNSIIDLNYSHDLTDKNTKDLDVDLSISPKEGFIDNLSKSPVFSFIRSQKISSIIKEDIDSIIRTKFPSIEVGSVYKLIHNGRYHLEENKIIGKIKQFIITSSSGKGIGLRGDIIIPNFIFPEITAEVIIYRADDTIKFWNEYYYSNIYSGKAVSLEYIDFNTQIITKLLRQISSFPESNALDIIFNIKYDALKNNISISEKNINNIRDEYYKIITNQIITKLKIANNKEEYLDRIAPELKPYINQFLDMEKSKQKISDQLWQKLIK